MAALEKLEIKGGLVINASDIENIGDLSQGTVKNCSWEQLGEERLGALLEKQEDKKVVVVSKNPITKESVYKLLSGHFDQPLRLNGFTGSAIRKRMAAEGYELVEEEKVAAEVFSDPDEQNIFITKGSMIRKYLDWLEEYVKADLDVDYFVQAYQYIGKNVERQKEEMPFLSVITRTQGKRIEALRETFLSLAGQSCDDFEVLVMGHNIEKDAEKQVIQAIGETPEFLRKKIRYIPVFGGNRSTPINKGFEAARGEYAVLLDDDDIVFDQWVTSFKEKAKENPGSIIHAYVVSQKWSLELDGSGREILRAEDAPDNQFCKDFHYLNELYGNSCPVLGLAFPLFPFKEMGFAFDETLDTTEDWDYLMSLCGLCGVADVQEVTSMYRLWNNAENSHSVHSVEEWNANRSKIQDRIINRPLLLPKQYAKELIDTIEENKYIFEKAKGTLVTPLYCDNGNGYNETDVKRSTNRKNGAELFYEYRNMEEFNGISSLRWDPCEHGNLYIENPVIIIDLVNGKRIVKEIDSIKSNGFKMGNKIIFFHPDPQMYVRFAGNVQIARVTIMGTRGDKITEDMHNYLAFRYDSHLLDKVKQKIKMVLKKVLRRL